MSDKYRRVNVFHLTREPHEAAYSKKLKHENVKFHQFGADFEEYENGAANYTTAIVELDDGTVITPPAHMIQFLDRE